MHRGAALRHQAADHARRGLVLEELGGDLEDGLPRRALAHADQHDTLPIGSDVAASTVAAPNESSQSPQDREVRA